ncbi:hypothetical protein GCK32_022815 [Trichostrongylus colubriformis]|uniref:Uncharacterized protein n=1 Tax=Trichostrongylus colubriformis TaxID=6319 RepID=A0AAN8FDU3_TRICO
MCTFFADEIPMPYCGSDPPNAREELILARMNLKKLSSPENYEDFRKKISDLLTKDSKDWNEGNLREALKSFSNGLQERLQSDQKVQNGDFKGTIKILGNLCCALKRGVGARCKVGRMVGNLTMLSKAGPKTPKAKFKYVANLIRIHVDDLDF